MSAEAQAVTETSAPADDGPQIITVVGQEDHVPVDTPEVVDQKAEAPEAKAAGSEEPVTEENRDEKGRFKPGVQNRIDELTRARREAEREAEYWKVRAQGTAAQNPAKAAPEVSEPPVRANFETDEAYMDALTDHKVEQKLAQRDQRQAQVQQQVTKADSWQSKLAAARTEIEGFDDVMNNTEAPVAAHVADLIMEHDQGAKVAHHYAMHPEELEKVNSMSPAKAAFEIGRLATKFEAQTSTTSSKPAAAEQVSKAPPPAARNVGSGRSTEVAMGDMSMDDYIAKRKAQGASWAR